MRVPDAHTAMDRFHRATLRTDSLPEVLQTVARLTTQVLPVGLEVSVCVLTAERTCTLLHTGRLALDLDEFQCRDGSGPSLHAARTRQATEVVDARADPRWPRYAAHAVQRGSLSSLSMGLGSYDGVTAALSIYSREPAAFDHEIQRTAKNLARVAARALGFVFAGQTAEEFGKSLHGVMRDRAATDC